MRWIMCSKKALQGITFDFKMQDFFWKIDLISQIFFFKFQVNSWLTWLEEAESDEEDEDEDED